MWDSWPSWARNDASTAVRRSRCPSAMRSIIAVLAAPRGLCHPCRVAWDFSTDPAFQEQLDWMAAFVREEIWPLETIDFPLEALDRAMAPLQERVKERRL